MSGDMNVKYYRVGKSGLGRLREDVNYDSYSFSENKWVENQYAISKFVDGMTHYTEISEEEAIAIINKRFTKKFYVDMPKKQ